MYGWNGWPTPRAQGPCQIDNDGEKLKKAQQLAYFFFFCYTNRYFSKQGLTLERLPKEHVISCVFKKFEKTVLLLAQDRKILKFYAFIS